MFKNKLILFLNLVYYNLCFCEKYEHELNTAIWSNKCTQNSYVLNECNWCRCRSEKFYCEARVCSKVDPFGHFNDAIQDIQVGMEGHGSWRTTPTTCEPGVQYKREKLLCVCTDEGQWPNPACRDTFRVLHSVEPTELALASPKQSCSPRKLYLIGCNVCFCPAEGKIDPELCTTKVCAKDDPVILKEELAVIPKEGDVIPKEGDDEIYATCQTGKKYFLGCQECNCLSNNRLLCAPCAYKTQKPDSLCSMIKPKQIFNNDCNLCYCYRGKTYCTVRRCLPKNVRVTKSEGSSEISESLFVLSKKPVKDEKCTPGTRYKKDCNTCFCSESDNGIKTVSCTVKQCSKIGLQKHLEHDCVEDTTYACHCLICTCLIHNGEKRKICNVDPKCLMGKLPEPYDVVALNGHCVPKKAYRNDCNNCTCLNSGKLVSCTSKVCNDSNLGKKEEGPMFRTVNIIPLKSDLKSACVPGHSYKVDCNQCFCMKNGNVLCTKADCKKGRL